MSGERVIPNKGSTDQPRFDVLINDSLLPKSVPILSVTVLKEFNRISSAKIILLDGDSSEEDFEWSSSDHFVPGNEIEIKVGYDQGTETVFKGIVVVQKIKIRAYADPWLIVECRDKAYKSTLGRKNRYFFDMTDSDIIDEILGEYDVTGNIESTSLSHKQMVQYRSTDWDFAVMRAEANGMVILTDDGTFNMFTPDTTAKAEFSVLYGATLIDFDGELDARIQSEKTESAGWDYAAQDITSSESGSIKEAAISDKKAADIAKDAGFEATTFRNTSLNNSDELQLWADSKQQKISNAKVRGRARFLGTPLIKPGMTLEIQGLGKRMNGSSLVRGVRNEFTNGGWTTDVELGTKDKFFHEENKVSYTQAGGLLPPVHGLEIGIVTAIEGDPDNEYRIRVKIPTLDLEDEGVWARICTLDAGAERGSFFRPEIEDEVIVGFLNDDPRNAIVLGMLNSSAKAAPSENSDDNHEKGFVTRSGMKIWFNDDPITMELETPNGNIITLSDDEGKISLVDENDNSIVLNSDGITIDSPGDITITAVGDVNIEGANVNVKANTNLAASGAAGTDLSSDAITVIKGSLIQIN